MQNANVPFIRLLFYKAHHKEAALAQLGERKTEDLKVTGSIPVGGIFAFMTETFGSECATKQARPKIY